MVHARLLAGPGSFQRSAEGRKLGGAAGDQRQCNRGQKWAQMGGRAVPEYTQTARIKTTVGQWRHTAAAKSAINQP
jgi:hypothetical protein